MSSSIRYVLILLICLTKFHERYIRQILRVPRISSEGIRSSSGTWVYYSFDLDSVLYVFSEEPEAILDRQDRVMRNKIIPFVKILWRNHPEREAT